MLEVSPLAFNSYSPYLRRLLHIVWRHSLKSFSYKVLDDNQTYCEDDGCATCEGVDLCASVSQPGDKLLNTC